MALYPVYPGNHLLRLAQPLFWTLDELTPELDSAVRLDELQIEVRKRLATFKSAGYAAALRADAVEAIHYCFCAAMDQAGSRVRGRTGNCRGIWLQRSLLKEFYEENGSGQRCRAWIAQLQQNRISQADALEVVGQLVARGLQDDCGAPLPIVSPVAYQVISRLQTKANHEIPLIAIGSGNRSGWMFAAITVALLCAVGYFLFRQHINSQVLDDRVSQLSARLAAQQESVDQRIARMLAPDIAAGAMSLGRKGDRVYLVFSSDSGFTAGKADITPRLARQLDQLATVLVSTAGFITVIGHTDASVTPQGGEASNLALSQARALAVGRYLQKHGDERARISIIGRGAADPVGDNRTEAGRALNRRIEIVIDRTPETAP